MNKADHSKRSARPLVESLTTVMPHLALVSKAKLRRLLREMRCRITLSGYGKNAASAGRARHRAAQQPHARCALEFTPPCGFRSLRPFKTALSHFVSGRRAMSVCQRYCSYYRFLSRFIFFLPTFPTLDRDSHVDFGPNVRISRTSESWLPRPLFRRQTR